MARRRYIKPLPPVIRVGCSKCGSTFEESKVRITSIEEGVFGEDMVSFKCPKCGEDVRSRRYG